jgi:hypothetical protein
VSEADRRNIANPEMIAIPWIHSPVASELKIALQGNPSPTSSLRPLSKLRVAHSSNWDPHGLPGQHSMKLHNHSLCFAQPFPLPILL